MPKPRAVSTPDGAKAQSIVKGAIERLDIQTGSTHIFFPDTGVARLDGFVTVNGIIVAAFEGKMRYAGLSERGVEYNGKTYQTYLITADKVNACMVIAKQLEVPFVISIYFTVTDNFLVFKMTDEHGKRLIDFEEAHTQTRETVNGGKITRNNAFIPVSAGKIIHLQKQ